MQRELEVADEVGLDLIADHGCDAHVVGETLLTSGDPAVAGAAMSAGPRAAGQRA